MKLDEAGLRRWGERIGASVRPPVTFALEGGLGAGKSVLARAIGRGAGVEQTMPSPSFNLLFRYRGARGIEVVHLDLYRIRDPSEVWDLGWSELGSGSEIVIVEWPGRIAGLMPRDHWVIELAPVEGAPFWREVQARAQGNPPPLPSAPEGADAGGIPVVRTEGSG